jgi:hypothetical protein
MEGDLAEVIEGIFSRVRSYVKSSLRKLFGNYGEVGILDVFFRVTVIFWGGTPDGRLLMPQMKEIFFDGGRSR